jgi:hypothetical protein
MYLQKTDFARQTSIFQQGAMAEELGKGLQNPVHECESRSRLQ